MFELAKDEWGLPVRENPLSKVRLSSAHARRERRLRNGELANLIAAARTCRNRLILPVILFAVETGMRRGEILSLRWEHIDRGGPSLLIPHSKNGHSRILPLTKVVADIIDTVPTLCERVFPLTRNAFRLAWERLRGRAGLVDLHFHDLRHEAISRFFEKGLSIPEVALLSGHRDARMLFRYTHPAREEIIRKLERADNGSDNALRACTHKQHHLSRRMSAFALNSGRAAGPLKESAKCHKRTFSKQRQGGHALVCKP
jgi:integrase